MSKVCPSCRGVYGDNEAFCPNCGTRLVAQQAAPAYAPQGNPGYAPQQPAPGYAPQPYAPAPKKPRTPNPTTALLQQTLAPVYLKWLVLAGLFVVAGWNILLSIFNFGGWLYGSMGSLSKMMGSYAKGMRASVKLSFLFENDAYTALRVLTILNGLVLLAVAAGLIFTRFRMAQYTRDARKIYMIVLLASVGWSLLYMLLWLVLCSDDGVRIGMNWTVWVNLLLHGAMLGIDKFFERNIAPYFNR